LFIPDPDAFFSHPGSRIQGSKRHPIPIPGSGSATMNISIKIYNFEIPGFKENIPVAGYRYLFIEQKFKNKI
jgi:hypothetical protein